MRVGEARIFGQQNFVTYPKHPGSEFGYEVRKFLDAIIVTAHASNTLKNKTPKNEQSNDEIVFHKNTNGVHKIKFLSESNEQKDFEGKITF